MTAHACEDQFRDLHVVGRVAQIVPSTPNSGDDATLVYLDSGPSRIADERYDTTGALRCALLPPQAKGLQVNDRVTVYGRLENLGTGEMDLQDCYLLTDEHEPLAAIAPQPTAAALEAAKNPNRDPLIEQMRICTSPGENPIACMQRYRNVRVYGRLAEIFGLAIAPESAIIVIDSARWRRPDFDELNENEVLTCSLPLTVVDTLSINDRVTLSGDLSIVSGRGSLFLTSCSLVSHAPSTLSDMDAP